MGDKDESDWILKEKIRTMSFKPGDDLEAFLDAFTYWVMENEDVGDNKKRRLLISRLSGDASELGVKLATCK